MSGNHKNFRFPQFNWINNMQNLSHLDENLNDTFWIGKKHGIFLDVKHRMYVYKIQLIGYTKPGTIFYASPRFKNFCNTKPIALLR